MRYFLLAWCLTLLCSCLSPSGKEGAVRVSIQLSSFRPGCLLVRAQESQGTKSSETQLRKSEFAPKSEILLAVFREPGWKENLKLSVQTFEGECSGTPVEQIVSEPSIRVSLNTISEWTVVLRAEDVDADGYAAMTSDFAGTDCNDKNANIRPTASELCDGTDVDCDNLRSCEDPDCANMPCNDGKACTHTDSCQNLACQGVTYACAPPNECFTQGLCQGDGSCNFTIQEGAPCLGGICHAAGNCIPTGPFPYLPPNFAPGSFDPKEDFMVPLNCALTLDSTSTLGFSNGCGLGTQPLIQVVSNGSAGELLLVGMKNFSLPSSSSITIIGNRPVIFGVYGDADVQGNIYINSKSNGGFRKGAGANPTLCGTSQGGDGTNGTTGGGGGGGGGNRRSGGRGGHVGNKGAGSAGSTRQENIEPLLGGCPGGSGAIGNKALGGDGGGAFQLSVAGTLTVDSTLSVSGAGGEGATTSLNKIRGGGGGGGSGGMLIVEANKLRIQSNTKLTANGGAGGGGTNTQNAHDGLDGSMESQNSANGGTSIGGGNGGQGGSRQSDATEGDSVTNAGAGGGGGGVGSIYVRHHSSQESCINQAAIMSPAPNLLRCQPN